MFQFHQPLKVAVIIATKDRCEFLANRSLPSVIDQAYPPDFLIVCDDSFPELCTRNAKIVDSVKLSCCETIYLKNHRTGGASGCWNSALDALLPMIDDPDLCFVAFLDDDDAWSPKYIESALTEINNRQLDMVASDISRIESGLDAPTLEQSPDKLCAEYFFTKNPGIQGSNLFLRLSTLLCAGGFDEDLQSTTDRDLCIRLADLRNVQYGRLPLALVEHYADTDRPRLSNRGSQAKLNGLNAFWRKYAGRMNANEQIRFTLRATELFDWKMPITRALPQPSINYNSTRTPLVLGLAIGSNIDTTYQIVDMLARYRDENMVGIDVVLFDQMPSGDCNQLDAIADRIRDTGAGCFPIRISTLSTIAETYDAESTFQETLNVKLIPELLKLFCSQISQLRPGSEAWIVNDLNFYSVNFKHKDIRNLLTYLKAYPHTKKEVTPSLHHLPESSKKQLNRWIQSEREITARHRIMKHFSLQNIRLLGCGSEAVVFTDGQTVFKCIDYWKTRTPEAQLKFLRNSGSNWIDIPGIYPLLSVQKDGPWVLLTYKFEKSTPYQGGHDEDLIRLLDGCTRAGIVCNNIHPKNLIMTSSGVKLVDYGSDIRPWSRLGFEHMALRTFLTCRYAKHPHLKKLMRKSLTDTQLPELSDYPIFRAKLSNRYWGRNTSDTTRAKAPAHNPYRLYIGVISSDALMLLPLLRSLSLIQNHKSIKSLSIMLLDNNCPSNSLDQLLHFSDQNNLNLEVITESRQREDAMRGIFGAGVTFRPSGQVGIAMGRTMLQRYLGTVLQKNSDSIGWILDDDMRIDDRAEYYLQWLPAFREQNIDVLLGAYEGASPNPPLNGLRVQLVDLYHNLLWLRNLPETSILPDRSEDNADQRARYPDYYYDLSRKHSGHLEMPHWLEPEYSYETVSEARARLISGAVGILNGDPITRAIITKLPTSPLHEAFDSVNRGGCTFILNHAALTKTPNSTALIHGKEARRSDMIWAIVNRHYRHMQIKAVTFPVHHTGRITDNPGLNLNKVQGEIVGSALYAGLTEFLENHPGHELNFSKQHIHEIGQLIETQMQQRLQLLELSFYRISGLCNAIRDICPADELKMLLSHLNAEFNLKAFQNIRSSVKKLTRNEIHNFLSSLRTGADDYALAADFNLALAPPYGSDDFFKEQRNDSNI